MLDADTIVFVAFFPFLATAVILAEPTNPLAGADAVEIIVVAVATFLVKFNSPIPFFADGFAETLLKLPPKTNTPAINNGIIFFVNFFLILLPQNH